MVFALTISAKDGYLSILLGPCLQLKVGLQSGFLGILLASFLQISTESGFLSILLVLLLCLRIRT
jgi:hypothetical protein